MEPGIEKDRTCADRRKRGRREVPPAGPDTSCIDLPAAPCLDLTGVTVIHILTLSHIFWGSYPLGTRPIFRVLRGEAFERMAVAARREKEKIQRRNDILKAARHLFFAKG